MTDVQFTEGVLVRVDTARDAGSCNFCVRQKNEDGSIDDSRVHVVESQRGGGPSVRFCDVCLADFRRQI